MPTRAEYYANTSRIYFSRSESYLAANDLLQTSEKGWAAAALMVKCVAQTRGWKHTSHYDLSRVVDGLVAATGDGEIRSLFNSAGELHRNFYEGRMPGRRVRNCLSRVAELMHKLENLIA